MQAADSDIVGQRQLVEPERLAVLLRFHQPGVKRAAQKARLLAGVVVGQIEKAVPARQCHGGRQVAIGRLQLIHERANAWEIIRRRRRVEIGAVVALTGQHEVQSPAMPRMLMVHAAEQTILVGTPREVGNVFANANAVHVGRDRPEFAAEMGWRVGLEIEDVDLARAAEEIDEDAGLRPTTAAARLSRAGRRFPAAQRHAERAQTAKLQDVAATGAIADALRLAEDAEHERSVDAPLQVRKGRSKMLDRSRRRRWLAATLE